MNNMFWGDIAEIITVKDNIPDKNLAILKKIHPNAEIIKEKSFKMTSILKSDEINNSYNYFDNYITVITNCEIIENSVNYEIAA